MESEERHSLLSLYLSHGVAVCLHGGLSPKSVLQRNADDTPSDLAMAMSSVWRTKKFNPHLQSTVT